MIKNGRFFTAPQKTDENFKQLFARLAAAGVGRPVDSEGYADGPWTPESLAEAISAIDGNREGVELRSVQVWFQDNDNGISDANIRWLARVFGCSDPEAASAWQAELKAAKERLAKERREKKRRQTSLPGSANGVEVELERNREDGRTFFEGKQRPRVETADATKEIRSRTETPFRGFSEKSDVLHSDSDGLGGYQSAHVRNERDEVRDTSIQPPKVRRKLQISAHLEALFADPVTPSVVVWFWLTGILFLASVLGVLSVTYMTPDGTNKQVGYIWSPSWVIHDLVLLPFFLMTVSRTINFWKTDARTAFLNDGRRSPHEGWLEKVSSLSILLWLAIAISVFFVFLLQWVGGYLIPILRNELGNTAVSWPIIILARPEIMSVGAALALSGTYILFAALVFFFLNAGFVFLYAVWSDFSDLFKRNSSMIRADDAAKMRFVGVRLVENIFLGTILALWISTSIKLYAMYLSVSSKDILTWLYTDLIQVFENSEQHENIIVGYSLSQFSTIIFTSVIVGVFLYIYFSAKALLNDGDGFSERYPKTYAPWSKWLIVVVLLLVNYLSVGQVRGFSLLLLLSIVVTAYCVLTHRGRNFDIDQRHHGNRPAKQ